VANFLFFANSLIYDANYFSPLMVRCYPSIHLSIYLWLYGPLLGLGRFFSSSFTQSVGLLGRGISPSQGCYLHTGQHKQIERTQTFMPQMGFEPTIPVFERAKTVHALDRATTAIGLVWCSSMYEIKCVGSRKRGWAASRELLTDTLYEIVRRSPGR
jgi:hypothetical protein